MTGCLFCRIIAGEIPARFAHRDDDVVAIADVNPQAPQHLLVIPVNHVPDLPSLAQAAPPGLIAKIFSVAAQLGRQESAGGFRVVVNTGELGGQTVDHVHVHVLAGREMRWPPG
ncbi:MAG: HIT domain-containing protein [Candidatus Baltobacteraceae bacterium]